MSRASCTQRPSSENTRTWARERAIRPELGELLARQSLGHRTDRVHVDEPGRPAQVEHPLGGLAVSVTGSVLAIARTAT
jgi:hypothetical protein